MSRDIQVYNLRSYDLGTVEPVLGPESEQSVESVLGPQPERTIQETPPEFATVHQPVAKRTARAPREKLWPDVVTSLSLFLPGVSQMVRGQVTRGLFLLSSLAFLGSIAWATLQTLDRLAVTLDLLGLSMYFVFWTLVWIYLMVVTIHLSGVWTATEDSPRRVRHPAVSAVASLIVPGWGQILNGDRLRAVLFLGAAWLAAGFWIAASPPVTELFNTHLPVVTPWEQLARTPLVLWTLRWTLPLVIGCLAVYDAASSAIDQRRQA